MFPALGPIFLTLPLVISGLIWSRPPVLLASESAIIGWRTKTRLWSTSSSSSSSSCHLPALDSPFADLRSSQETVAFETNMDPPGSIVLSWEPDVEAHIRTELSRRATGNSVVDDTMTNTNVNQPLIVGLVGIPGSGKSTSATILSQNLAHQGALHMPMDGYHYSIDQLLQFPNPKDAIYRRGAPDTFDVESLRRALEQIKCEKESMVIQLPGFDHARGDPPEPHAYTFDRNHHRVVILEGLYLLHDQGGWETIAPFLDLTVFIDADIDLCIDRLKIRNQCIPGYTKEEIELRCDVVDQANAILVDQSRQRAHILVQGIACTSKHAPT